MSLYIYKSFAKHNFRELKKDFRGVSCCNTGGLCDGESLHGPLDQLPRPLANELQCMNLA